MSKKNVPVPGKSKSWLGTAIYLKQGQTAKINANGEISFGPLGTWKFTPEGELNRTAEGSAPAPGLVKNSLVARAGGSAAYIGSSGEITAERDTQLLVAINDDFTDDNDGYWMLTIEY
jgi:hypothetical protein